MQVQVRRGADRAVTRTDWLTSRHAFSFGAHYDPANTSFGLLLALNEDTLAPGSGFGPHPHRDLEIVSWVVAGELRHEDSAGARGRAAPGLVQCLSAGSGVVHSEVNASTSEPLHLVQSWLQTAEPGAAPAYATVDLREALAAGEPVAVASGRGHPGAAVLRQPGAVLWAVRPRAGARVDLPGGASVHLLVTRGRVELEGAGTLEAGDAARVRDVPGLVVRCPEPAAELLVWEMSC